MNFNRGSRTWHSWAGILAAIPLLVIVCTGLLLQVKKQVAWVQPREMREDRVSGTISLDQILAVAKSDARLGIESWDDVQRVDVRPSKGLAKVTTKNGWEGQIGLTTGKLLQVAPRRSDVIESLHDGSFFGGDITKLGVFLPAGLALLSLILTGIWLFILPRKVRWQKRKRGTT